MKHFTYKYTNSEGEEKEIKLRLTSQDSEQIEKDTGKALMDYVQGYSTQTILRLLKDMIKGAGEVSFTKNMAYDLYDELIDSGLTVADILDKVIYEALVISGIISQDNLNEIRAEQEKIKNMTDEEKMKRIKERKNL